MNEVVINRPSRALPFGEYRYVYSISELELRKFYKYSHSCTDEFTYTKSLIRKLHPEMVRIKILRYNGWVYIGVNMPREAEDA